MKRFFYVLMLLTLIGGSNAEVIKSSITMTINNQKQEKMKLLLGLVNPSQDLLTMATLVQTDLSCFPQKLSGFNVEIQRFEKIPSKKKMKGFFKEGFNLVVLLSSDNEGTVDWRLYDALQAQMQKGKRVAMQKTVQATAHAISDQLWQVLTGQGSIFTTKIAYCQTVNKNKNILKNIYIQSPTEANASCFVEGGKLLAGRWNKDPHNPLILYSEVTKANIRLMSVGLDGKRKIISNLDGLTMLANFSSNGQKVVYCASYKGSCQLYYYFFDSVAKKCITKRLTNNQGNNTSPNICENGDIIFCSDYETKSPQIYSLNATTGELKRLTTGGYCACPSYCPKNKTIAYSKLVGNDMQVFLYNLNNQEHKQVTFDKGSKDECTWSPCGNYLAYVLKGEKSSRIAVQNMLTQERFFLTRAQDECSYPSWSEKFNDLSIFV